MNNELKYIICQDSSIWLEEQKDHSIRNFVTSIPDFDEMGNKYTMKEYIQFFENITSLIFKKVSLDGYCIFYQTDRKYDGKLIDKSFLISNIANKEGINICWHKIVCCREPGKIHLQRPTYSHLLCYSFKGKSGKPFADILPVSKKLYKNGIPENAVVKIIDFIKSKENKESKESKQKKKKKENTLPQVIVDPFVGKGTIGIEAIKNGLVFLGIDIDPQQCKESNENIKKIIDEKKEKKEKKENI